MLGNGGPFWYDDASPLVPGSLVFVQVSKGVQFVCSPIIELPSKKIYVTLQKQLCDVQHSHQLVICHIGTGSTACQS